MTFSEQIVYGWFKPSKYKDMIELPRRRFVAYVIAMMLVLAIVSYVVPTASIISGFGGFEKLFTQSLGEVNIRTIRFRCPIILICISTPRIS